MERSTIQHSLTTMPTFYQLLLALNTFRGKLEFLLNISHFPLILFKTQLHSPWSCLNKEMMIVSCWVGTDVTNKDINLPFHSLIMDQ